MKWGKRSANVLDRLKLAISTAKKTTVIHRLLILLNCVLPLWKLTTNWDFGKHKLRTSTEINFTMSENNIGAPEIWNKSNVDVDSLG